MHTFHVPCAHTHQSFWSLSRSEHLQAKQKMGWIGTKSVLGFFFILFHYSAGYQLTADKLFTMLSPPQSCDLLWPIHFFLMTVMNWKKKHINEEQNTAAAFALFRMILIIPKHSLPFCYSVMQRANSSVLFIEKSNGNGTFWFHTA